MIKILFVCHGNICRSTMAESVMTYLVSKRHLSDRFRIASAATSREEIGNSPHYGTVGKLRAVGIPVIHKLLEYAGSSRAIADPWYTGDFDATYDDIMEGCEAFMDFLMRSQA